MSTKTKKNNSSVYISKYDLSYNNYSKNNTFRSNNPQRKVSFNPKVAVIEIENTKIFNLENSINRKQIFENMSYEKKRKIEERRLRLEEEERRKSCVECNIF